MINSGRDGSLSFFFENKLIASVPLNENYTYEDWLDIGNNIILDGMRDTKMKLQGSRGIKTAFWKYFTAQAFLALIKLKQIDPDGDTEGLFVQPSKRPVVRK